MDNDISKVEYELVQKQQNQGAKDGHKGGKDNRGKKRGGQQSKGDEKPTEKETSEKETPKEWRVMLI